MDISRVAPLATYNNTIRAVSYVVFKVTLVMVPVIFYTVWTGMGPYLTNLANEEIFTQHTFKKSIGFHAAVLIVSFIAGATLLAYTQVFPWALALAGSAAQLGITLSLPLPCSFEEAKSLAPADSKDLLDTELFLDNGQVCFYLSESDGQRCKYTVLEHEDAALDAEALSVDDCRFALQIDGRAKIEKIKGSRASSYLFSRSLLALTADVKEAKSTLEGKIGQQERDLQQMCAQLSQLSQEIAGGRSLLSQYQGKQARVLEDKLNKLE